MEYKKILKQNKSLKKILKNITDSLRIVVNKLMKISSKSGKDAMHKQNLYLQSVAGLTGKSHVDRLMAKKNGKAEEEESESSSSSEDEDPHAIESHFTLS